MVMFLPHVIIFLVKPILLNTKPQEGKQSVTGSTNFDKITKMHKSYCKYKMTSAQSNCSKLVRFCISTSLKERCFSKEEIQYLDKLSALS